MDNAIIDNINQAVDKNDTLFFLGDFCWSNRDRPHAVAAAHYRERINCSRIIFIFGNHDKRGRGNSDFMKLFNGCYDMLEVNGIVLCHYAMRVWDKMHHGNVHIFGHSHGSLPDDPESRSFDCGVDCWGYRPINEDDVHAVMKRKKFKALDHHGR
jgi:calcineurin-like phosphoesterase family protein